MIEFLIYIVIFMFIYTLSNQVKSLQNELFALKGKSRLRKKGRVFLNEPQIEMPIDIPVKVHKPKIIEKSYFTKQVTIEPNAVDKIFEHIKRYFTEGNIIVRIGGVILFFGLAFLAKYAAENSVVSIEVRLIGIALSSIIIGIFGWRLRRREGYYGIILQGISIAIAYLLIFATAKFYTLIPLTLSFAVMFLIVIFGSLLALIQNALPLAIFSIGGGFLAPILTSDGSGSHIMLFSYFALLNSGIVGIAWYRSWRVLNLMGFFFTFVIAVAWGVLKYDSTLLMSAEPFLILFFLFYLAVSILFTLKQSFQPRGVVDATLVFGLPLITFSLQTSLVQTIEYALFSTAIAMGTLYFVLFKVLSRFPKMMLLSKAFLALGVIFYTISIPHIFDNQLTGALWALEASAVIWMSLKQKHLYTRIFGELLLVVATAIYVASSLIHSGDIIFLNTTYLGYIIVSIASFISAYQLYINRSQLNHFDKYSSNIFLSIALTLWLFSGLIEAKESGMTLGNVMLIYISISTLILTIITKRFKWDTLSNLLKNYLILGILFFISLIGHYLQYHPFEGLGAIAIVLFFLVHYYLLYLHKEEWNDQAYLHLVALWIIVAIGALELKYGISLLTQNSIYGFTGFGLFIILSASIIMYKKRFLPKVFNNYKNLYQGAGVRGIVIMLSLWELFSFTLNANPAPLPYIPFLNPLELTQIFGFILMYKWLKMEKNSFITQYPHALYSASGIVVLLFSTIILARSIHFYIDIDYSVFALSHSIIFQMSISLLWSIIAMSVMLLAKRLQHRPIWIAGASLMGVVVVKLFLVELASSGSVERIVSFIVVGVLLLLIGYFAPLPPLKSKKV